MPFKEDSKQLVAKLDEQKKIFDAQDARALKAKQEGADEAAIAKAAEPTPEETTQLKALDTEIKDLDTKCAESKQYQEMRERNDDLRKTLRQPVDRPDFGNPQVSKDEYKSAGQLIINSPDFKQWLDRVAPDGKAPNAKMRLESPTVNLKELGFGDLERKSLVMSVPTTAGGGLVRRDYGPWPIDLPLRPLTIRDVVTILQTGSNLIEYVRVDALTRAAKIVPEATSTTDDNALKPEAGMTFEIVQTGVKTIAVTMPATRTILMDVPQLKSIFTKFLRP